MIAYWTERAQAVSHSILKARYAGLAWDLAGKVAGAGKNENMARTYVEAALEIAEKRLGDHERFAMEKLAYALAVAISINDQTLLARVRTSIIALEDVIAKDEMLGLWGFSFRLLLNGKKTGLTQAEEDGIVRRMEERLARIQQQAGNWHFSMERVVELLAPYYQRKTRLQDRDRVCAELLSALDRLPKGMAPFMKKGYYETAERNLRRWGAHDLAKTALQVVQKLGPASREAMKGFKHTMEVPRDRVIAHTREILSGDLEQAISRFISAYLPSREQVKAQVNENASKFIFQFLCRQALVDADGRTTAVLGDVESDDAHLAKHLAMTLQFQSLFMRHTCREFCSNKDISPATLLAEIEKSSLFDSSDLSLLKIALDAYWQENAVVFIHVAIPRIESALRELAGSMEAILKPSRANDGGYHLQTLDQVLRMDSVKHCYGEDVAWYLRVLLTENRGGLNLRNDVCHGMCNVSAFNMHTADLIFHALLLVASVRPAPAPSAPPQEAPQPCPPSKP